MGEHPIFQIGPIGPCGDHFVAYLTDKGLRIDAAGLHQTSREIFERYLSNELEDNVHVDEYRAVLTLIDAHARLLAPKEGEV